MFQNGFDGRKHAAELLLNATLRTLLIGSNPLTPCTDSSPRLFLLCSAQDSPCWPLAGCMSSPTRRRHHCNKALCPGQDAGTGLSTEPFGRDATWVHEGVVIMPVSPATGSPPSSAAVRRPGSLPPFCYGRHLRRGQSPPGFQFVRAIWPWESDGLPASLRNFIQGPGRSRHPRITKISVGSHGGCRIWAETELPGSHPQPKALTTLFPRFPNMSTIG